MKLKEWLIKNKMTVSKMSVMCGFNRNTISTALGGVQAPNAFSERVLKAIFEITKGEVTPNDLLFEKWQTGEVSINDDGEG